MNLKTPVRLIAAITLFTATSHPLRAQEIVVTPLKAGSVYAQGEKVGWNLELRGTNADQATEIRYTLKKNGYLKLSEGALPLTGGKTTLEASLDEPGTLLAELRAKLPNKEVSALAGAAVNPSKIAPSLPRPSDFDSFWKAKLAQLRAIPANPRLEPIDCGKPEIEYNKIQMDNINGSHIYGQIAKAKGKNKLPALLIVQWAGVYPLQPNWVISRAQGGWLTLNIEAHDIPFDQPQDYYDKLSATTLSNYPGIGNDNRDTAYFLRMYLSCYRAAEYLAKRSDWDGKTLVVTGGSQGGLQTIVTAALHPKVTAGIACVPAGCDLNGPVANRAPGWPMWWWQTKDKDETKVRDAARYYDVVNFASRVKCPVLVGMGLVDVTCPPSGVFAMINQLKGSKEVVVMPEFGHMGPHEAYYKRSDVWFQAIVAGKPAPVASVK